VKQAFVVFLLLAVVIGVLPAAAQDSIPRFEPTSCNFTIPNGQDPQCGYLVVPENRSNPGGKTIKIALAVFKSSNPNKAPDPVIYLDGGPGGMTLNLAALEFDSLFAPFLQNNDLILFDQRGVGLSQPSLDCKEVTDFIYATMDTELTVDEYVQQYGDALKVCGQRLSGEGIDAASYNSAESASDVDDMRAALGYDKLNLLGISYGTRLALTVMRDHPDGVRSSIIDSVLPPQASFFDGGATTAQRVLDTLFKGCAADSACHEAYPDLETVFYDLVDKFNKQPISIPAPNLKSSQRSEAVIDGDSLISTFFQAFYLTDLIPTLPQSVYDIQKGDYTLLTTITTLQLLQLSYISLGMNMAVNCKEEIPFDNAASVNAILQSIRPELRGFARRELIDPSAFDVCAAWKEGAPNPIENQPVVSDIPTLVFSGEYDPITPPDYGREAAQTLSKGYFFEFPGIGHGVIPSSPCATGMAQAFITDPTVSPDATCLAQVQEPYFVTPGNSGAQNAPITLVPFNNTTMGITGVVPDGWKELITGTYSRAQSGIDQTALAYQVIPGANVQLALPLLSSQFGITDTQGTSREANGLIWRLFEGDFGGAKLNLAMADGNTGVYLIILVTNNANDQSYFYDQVFLPAIDALQPLA
jgi:pimeloyl-ACP methyl ester carboxylesterase